METNTVSGSGIASGSITVSNAFILEILGPISFGYLSASGAGVYVPFGASINWVENRS